MVKILVLTDDFEKWIEKFEENLKVEIGYKRKYEAVLRNDLFSVEIRNRISENCRGKVIDVVILDKWIETEKEWLLRSLMGHRNSVVRTDKYYEEEKINWSEKNGDL